MSKADSTYDVYREEIADLLEASELALVALKEDPQDTRHIDDLFRSIHTIKGSSGLFGFDAIVGFAHIFENVLGDVREGRLDLNEAIVSLFLDCIPLIEQQVVAELDGTTTEKAAALSAEVADYSERMARHGASPPVLLHQSSTESSNTRADAEEGRWHLSMRFDAGVLRDGMDPLGFVRYLQTLGDIESLVLVDDALHSSQEYNALDCYIGFEIGIRTDATRETLEGVFEFVREASSIRLVAPGSQVAEYIALIESLPQGQSDRLGDILVASGALSAAELQRALRAQQQAGADRPLLGSIISRDQGVAEPVVEAALDKQSRERGGIERRSVRVPISSLEELINLVGELVISSAGASLLAGRLHDPELVQSVTNVAKLIESVRDVAMSLRMVEIGQTFNKFRRAVRQLSVEAGKEIELELHGGEAELDKTIVEKIRDPLTHLVRNAVDHGIESAEERVRGGKSAVGRISLTAAHESGYILIKVKDDGRGLDRTKIHAKAVERGLISAEQELDNNEIYDLIFAPGFSTAEKITNISGRGVGMDVVKRNIASLRGHITVESELGVGTTISIRLPLTLAIVDGFLVRVGSSFYVLPLELVVECIESGRQDRVGDSECIRARGRVIPYMPLADLFDDGGPRSARQDIIIVQFAGQMAGLMVDELLGEYQTVVKPLGNIFAKQPCFTGATILASGEVAMLLDAPALVREALGRGRGRGDKPGTKPRTANLRPRIAS